MTDRAGVTTSERRFAANGRRFPANAKGFLFAPVAWFLWFLVLYSVQGAGCALGLERAELLGTSVLRFALGALTVLVAAAIAAVGYWAFWAWERLRDQGEDAGGRPIEQSQFLAYGALSHALLFIVAIAWSGLPLLMTDLCSPSPG